MAGKWVMNSDGQFVPAKNWTHNTAAAPTNHGITPGKAPAGIVKNPSAAPSKPERRFDKATEAQIKAYMKEDDEWGKKQTNIQPVVDESREDLKSGKMKLDPDIFRKDGGLAPFKAVEGADGRVHVVREDKVPHVEHARAPAVATNALVLPPTEGVCTNPNAPRDIKSVVKKGFQAIMNSDGASHLRRTF